MIECEYCKLDDWTGLDNLSQIIISLNTEDLKLLLKQIEILKKP